jgi:outer membrane protein assembly factor BamE
MHRFYAPTVCRIALCLSGLGALAACSTVSNTTDRVASIITPFRPEIVQGNLISKEQVDLLQAGMSRNQVRDILGSPLLTSVFHTNRWDYTFTLKRSGVEDQARRLTVYFKGEVVERFEGDTMPSEAEFVSKLEPGRKLGKIPPLEASEESLRKFTEANPRAPAPARPLGSGSLPTSYPPLESPAR